MQILHRSRDFEGFFPFGRMATMDGNNLTESASFGMVPSTLLLPSCQRMKIRSNCFLRRSWRPSTSCSPRSMCSGRRFIMRKASSLERKEAVQQPGTGGSVLTARAFVGRRGEGVFDCGGWETDSGTPLIPDPCCLATMDGSPPSSSKTPEKATSRRLYAPNVL